MNIYMIVCSVQFTGGKPDPSGRPYGILSGYRTYSQSKLSGVYNLNNNVNQFKQPDSSYDKKTYCPGE